MWPLATLAASLRTDTSPPNKGGFYIGTPHSPSALALRSRPPHSPLSPRPPSPFCCASALALRPRPPLSPSALALNSDRFSAGCRPPRPDITAAHCCHLGGLAPASPRRYTTRPTRPITTRSRPTRPLAYAGDSPAPPTLAADTAARLRGGFPRYPHATQATTPHSVVDCLLRYAADTAANHTLAADTAARLRGGFPRSPNARGQHGRSLTRGIPPLPPRYAGNNAA